MRQFEGTYMPRRWHIVLFASHVRNEFLSNLMRVTPIIVVPTSRETRETKLP